MRLLPAAVAALIVTSPAFAGEIIWRSLITGTLTFVQPPPELETPDPNEPFDLGVSYGVTKVRPGTSLFISPSWPSGHPKTGYTFASPDLPATLMLDLSTGMISGRIPAAGQYLFSVAISDSSGRSQTIPVTIIVQ
jgi:hypothetical protein